MIQKQVLDNINISIKKNNITAIVGKSGIGKSTIIDLILSLNDPSSGSIFVDDELITNYDLQTYRSNIGYVPQDPILLMILSKNNLLWSNKKATDEDILDALKKSNALNLQIYFKKLIHWLARKDLSYLVARGRGWL